MLMNVKRGRTGVNGSAENSCATPESSTTDMPRHKIEWTDEMLEELVVNFAILSDSVLSQRLRVSISTIRRKAHEMELVKSTVGRNSFQTWVLVEEMFGKHSNREIADAAHVTERTVRRICKRLGLKLPKETRAMYISCSLTKPRPSKVKKGGSCSGWNRELTGSSGKTRSGIVCSVCWPNMDISSSKEA